MNVAVLQTGFRLLLFTTGTTHGTDRERERERERERQRDRERERERERSQLAQ